jgi:2-oxoglutarate dehydrogenase E1 component
LEFAEGTRFQRLIPEVLHPNPLSSSEVMNSNDTIKKLPGNAREARIPYSMTSVDHPVILANSAKRENHKPSLEFKLLPPSKIRTLIFCSGQVYYLLAKARALNQLNHIAIVRIEQINPFPFWEVKEVTDFYPNLEEIVYCQEESFNSGSWTFVEPRLDTSIRETDWYKSGKVVFIHLLIFRERNGARSLILNELLEGLRMQRKVLTLFVGAD